MPGDALLRPGPPEGGLALAEPPLPTTADGSTRRVGVEIEFTGPSARDAALLVRDLYGGTIEERDPRRFLIRDTRLGTFETELDSQYVHPKDKTAQPTDKGRRILDELRNRAALAMGDAARHWLPVEVVSPPVPWTGLDAIDAIARSLRGKGAEGTHDGLFYAFALQLNPEAARLDAGYILSILQAYLLAEAWLKARIEPDALRRLLGFASDFPEDYAALVLAPDYAPDAGRLMEDYAAFNCTRNRGLDLWPLFAHLDKARVGRLIDEPLIKARPAFHYRLPDARLSDPAWSIAVEWNDWVAVERLAADPDRLRAMAQAWRRHMAEDGSESRWARHCVTWLG